MSDASEKYWEVKKLIAKCWKHMLNREDREALRAWSDADSIVRRIDNHSLPENSDEYEMWADMCCLVHATKDTLFVYGHHMKQTKKDLQHHMTQIAGSLFIGDLVDREFGKSK